MQPWQHCKLHKNRVSFLGASGLLDNKADAYASERSAWNRLEETGWELVSVIVDQDGELVYYFKRPAPAE